MTKSYFKSSLIWRIQVRGPETEKIQDSHGTLTWPVYLKSVMGRNRKVRRNRILKQNISQPLLSIFIFVKVLWLEFFNITNLVPIQCLFWFGTSYNYKLSLTPVFEPGCTPLRWCFGSWSVVLLVGLLDLQWCPLLGQVPREVVFLRGLLLLWRKNLYNKVIQRTRLGTVTLRAIWAHLSKNKNNGN